jgi:hypothetical protein
MKDFIVIFLPTTIIFALLNIIVKDLHLILTFSSLMTYFSIGSMIAKFEKSELDIKDDWEGILPSIDSRLNHKNLKIRKYHREQHIMQDVEANICVLFLWEFYILFQLDFLKQNEFFDDFFDNCMDFMFFKYPITNFIYKKRIEIINIEKITENSKELTVSHFNNGIIEYRYKDQLHRENNKPAIELDSDCFVLSNRNEKYYLYDKEYSEYNIKEALKKIKIDKF